MDPAKQLARIIKSHEPSEINIRRLMNHVTTLKAGPYTLEVQRDRHHYIASVIVTHDDGGPAFRFPTGNPAGGASRWYGINRYIRRIEREIERERTSEYIIKERAEAYRRQIAAEKLLQAAS